MYCTTVYVNFMYCTALYLDLVYSNADCQYYMHRTALYLYSTFLFGHQGMHTVPPLLQIADLSTRQPSKTLVHLGNNPLI